MLLNYLIDSIETHKDNFAICCSDREVTYEELGNIALSRSKDFTYREYVNLVVDDGIEFMFSFWSALLVGAIPIVTKTKSDIDLSAVGPHAEFINQTSGTTGKAKYMHKTPDVMYTRMEMSKSYLPFDVGQETLLSLAPMYHSMGLDHGMVQSVMCKSNFVYLNKFTPKRFFKEMSKYKPTIIQLGSPRNANIILNNRDFDGTLFTNVKYTYSSGEPVSKELKQRWQFATESPLLEGLGCTEAGMITMETMPQRLGSVGKPIDPENFRIVDGEIQVRGDYVLFDARAGHHRDSGWYATGDLAKQDEQGYVYMSGRK